MADLAHIKMESANGSNGNGSATDLPFGAKEASLLVAKSNDKTRSMIEQCSGFSGTLESILLALLHNQDQLEQSLLAARHDFHRETERLREELGQEARQREKEKKVVEQLIEDGLSKASGDVAAQGRYSVLFSQNSR